MRTYTQKPFIKLVHRLLDRIGEDSSGTYNKQDPTHWSKGSIEVEVNGIQYTIDAFDCTWGTTIEIESENFKSKLYLSHGFGPNEDDEICDHGNKDGTFIVLYGIVKQAEQQFESQTEIQEQYNREDEMDPAGGHGLASHV